MSAAVRLLLLFLVWSTVFCSVHGQQQDDASSSSQDVYCLTVHQDLVRRQTDEWGSNGPFDVEDGTKHTPFSFFNASTRLATVIVGNGDDVGGVYHPMVASDNPTTVHFITHIYAVDQNNQIFAVETMDPNQAAPATVVFEVPEDVTAMTAFEFCNLHGLWMGPTVETPLLGQVDNATTVAAVERAGDDPSAAMEFSMMCHVDSPVPVAFDSFAADFVRRQSLPPFNSLEPYDEEDGTKHTPYIQLHDNGTATVTVGVEGNYHVMKGSSRDLLNEEPHWITDVYVVDQNGTILTMQSLNPSNVDIAQIQFEVPSNATTLTAYEWCNVHGLYRGPTISAATGQVIDTNTDDEEMKESAALLVNGMTMMTTSAMVLLAASFL
ncbi:Desulfoferrodoxin [Seminavis robusta]|uniref:Desulfoferrodoxin n=1 Tax=Seminavis robusta TaxID=568900 RepID=A0A9N8DB12_9STRA|nr:Desulfoferrodoxin [Seminavis robusta]|eukprot:Sro20_g014220.1 Desulfoferrodoxin (380) ;mRNA; r:114304-115551